MSLIAVDMPPFRKAPRETRAGRVGWGTGDQRLFLGNMNDWLGSGTAAQLESVNGRFLPGSRRSTRLAMAPSRPVANPLSE